jgi:anaerobic ribonucleoside-triphosphate reductase activating protein
MSKIVKVKPYTIKNGNGIRTSVFFSGCKHYCKNCFNRDIWDFNIGEEFNREFYENKIKPTINEHIAGISILGGEPFHPKNIAATYTLLAWFKHDFPNKNVWIWSGYTYEELLSEEYELALDMWDYMYGTNVGVLGKTDVLVDGRFIEEQKDLTLKFRGSTNQRVIDVPKSLRENKVILYKE